MAEDLDGMSVFVAVAEAKGFRAAGDRLGVSASAVSQAIRRLEARLGVVLVQRTTRSVRLTEAGERLYAAARPALDELRTALASVTELADEPRGTLRLLVATAAETFLQGPVLDGFLAAYPEVRLDLSVSNEVVDIVARGYDAGIQLGEVIDQDMQAVAVSEELQNAVVGSPAYFARHPPPRHPRDLAAHVCLNWRPTPEAPPYRWEFTEGGRDFSVAVNARVTTTEAALKLRLACRGFGLASSSPTKCGTRSRGASWCRCSGSSAHHFPGAISITQRAAARRLPFAHSSTICGVTPGVRGPGR